MVRSSCHARDILGCEHVSDFRRVVIHQFFGRLLGPRLYEVRTARTKSNEMKGTTNKRVTDHMIAPS